MNFASVAVNSPFAGRRSYTYSIPVTLQLAVGQAVWVPFGARILQGIVTGLSAVSDIKETRDIDGIISEVPLLNSLRIELAAWISAHYLCPLFDAVSLMLAARF
jgi:primosomal protein N' (replication factor Y)